MQAIDRGPRRRAGADIFLSHSSKDKTLALRLATDLSFCGVDAWLDSWEIQIGQSLVDVVAGAMEKARYIAIVISNNYNKSIWTKREYKKALAREDQEGRVVMLPLLLENAEVPEFIEERKYVDLREQYYSGLAQIAAVVHGPSEFRINSAIQRRPPQSVGEIWTLLESVGFEPFVVFGRDDFEEILKHGGEIIREDYAHFFPQELLASAQVSEHVKALLREVFPRHWYHALQGGKQALATQSAQR